MAIRPSVEQYFASRKSKGHVVVADLPKFDLDLYIANYSGRTRYERLMLIGCSSILLCIDALKGAVVEAKRGKDVSRYAEAQQQLQQLAPDEPEAILDFEWMETITKQNEAETAKLEAELKGYKNNLIKESIRMGNEDLGKHYLAIGDPNAAFEAFSRMRADVSLPKHIVGVSLHALRVALEQRNWIAVLSSVQKVRSVQQAPEEEKLLQPYLAACSGLASLCGGVGTGGGGGGDYHQAAAEFLRVGPGLGARFGHTLGANDVAVYGGLCALASMDRGSLRAAVLESATGFRGYLELEPHVRRAVACFVDGRYAACLAVLEAHRADHELDVYLQGHVRRLYARIRSKSIVQYFVPFSCVTLATMQETFGRPAGGAGGETVEQELVRMIRTGVLDARIDTQNGLLVSVPKHSRGNLHRETIETAKAYEKEALWRLQRANLLGANLEVRSWDKAKGGAGQGMMGGAMINHRLMGLVDDFAEVSGSGRGGKGKTFSYE